MVVYSDNYFMLLSKFFDALILLYVASVFIRLETSFHKLFGAVSRAFDFQQITASLQFKRLNAFFLVSASNVYHNQRLIAQFVICIFSKTTGRRNVI